VQYCRTPLLHVLTIIGLLILGWPAEARSYCAHPTASWTGLIERLGGSLVPQLKSIYMAEDRNNCYVGDHGSSFGPFQLHYPGVGTEFTRQTGLNARNQSSMPAQVRFMRRWGMAHHGYSSSIWHGLRDHPRRHWRHYRHAWHYFPHGHHRRYHEH